MHFEFLLEEQSAEAALRNLVPRVVGPGHTFDVHYYRGKPDLLAKLPDRLRAYKKWIPPDWRIVVLIDEDRVDCHLQKARLDCAAQHAGLVTKTAAPAPGHCQVMNRLAVEELEAWFFGDIDAITAAYPRVSAALGARVRYRDPDTIAGGTWEQLERELQRAGYYPNRMPKIEVARRISQHMDPARNRSGSFRAFRDGLLELAG